MRFVLSRKGFDSSWGGHDSVILRRETMVALPIPIDPQGQFARADRVSYNELRVPGRSNLSYLDLMLSHGMRSLTVGRRTCALDSNLRCHLDPDLIRDVMNRPGPWKAAFGQCESAEGHLRRQGVDVGDVFLFFGRFRHSCGTHFCDPAPKHVLFGYLQVGHVYRTDRNCTRPEWTHPHFEQGYVMREGRKRRNAVYAASDELVIAGQRLGVPGYGIFRYNDALVLTRNGARSHTEWALPAAFRNVAISYHGNGETYGWRDGGEFFQSAHRGQEFVLEANEAIIEWFSRLLCLRLS